MVIDIENDPNSDYFRTFEEIVLRHGFDFEQYEVETEDGYLLTVFRIRSGNYRKPAIFL